MHRGFQSNANASEQWGEHFGQEKLDEGQYFG